MNSSRGSVDGWLDGNPNCGTNLVLLTAKEHILSHHLLCKIYKNRKVISGYNILLRRFKSKKLTLNVPCAEETKQKIGFANSGERCASFAGYYLTPAGAFDRAQDAAASIGVGEHSIRKWCKQTEHFSAMQIYKSNFLNTSHEGKTPEEIGFGFRPAPRVVLKKIKKLYVCPHCNKHGSIGIMNRYHFEKCKSRKHPKPIKIKEHHVCCLTCRQSGASKRFIQRHVLSEQCNALLSKKEKDKINFEKTRQRMLNRPKIQCPHCGMVGSDINMNRYHFDKCKFKQ